MGEHFFVQLVCEFTSRVVGRSVHSQWVQQSVAGVLLNNLHNFAVAQFHGFPTGNLHVDVPRLCVSEWTNAYGGKPLAMLRNMDAHFPCVSLLPTYHCCACSFCSDIVGAESPREDPRLHIRQCWPGRYEIFSTGWARHQVYQSASQPRTSI